MEKKGSPFFHKIASILWAKSSMKSTPVFWLLFMPSRQTWQIVDAVHVGQQEQATQQHPQQSHHREQSGRSTHSNNNTTT
jgi:hypothetical protein